MVFRTIVSKKPSFDTAARKLEADIAAALHLRVAVMVFNVYDVEGVSAAQLQSMRNIVFGEPPVDQIFDAIPYHPDYDYFAVEYLPGQYDQRADSAEQCIRILTLEQNVRVRCMTVYAVGGASKSQLATIKGYLINAVESREADFELPKSLVDQIPDAESVQLVDRFVELNPSELAALHSAGGFAMTLEDLEWVQLHFRSESRNPTQTELKVIDTYWSDHCRHTTFLTHLQKITIKSPIPYIAEAFTAYVALHNSHYMGRIDKYTCLMDIATIAVRELKRQGRLTALDESDEINACSIRVPAMVNGKVEEWLVMFKNETHNHPTEIEPFGGAATCLGGAIRDPLSGRSYVYQAMRITGSGDPTAPAERTLRGKLSQRYITRTAAAGFCSYGNQIGLATGKVAEMYHPGYVAKRLECGFVVGAAPAGNVVRRVPVPGDIVILVGGETGRDGCGGATGSSRAHSTQSLATCGAEVQKGNPLTERKLQKLFRDPAVTTMIKRCNDFGAGGVSVAIGELSRGLDIDLSVIPKKYLGLSGTELAISESQERMAVVIAAADEVRFYQACAAQNVAATKVATITDTDRLRMYLGGVMIVDIARKFLDSNGVRQTATALIEDPVPKYFGHLPKSVSTAIARGNYTTALCETLADLNVCSQKGLGERFDSTIGAGSVLMPFGGAFQLTPSLAMVAKLPVIDGNTDTATVAAYGCNPDLLSESPFVGTIYSILTSVIKAVATGAPYDSIYLTLQEYFHRLHNDPRRWGQPTSAMLGALYAQLQLGLGAIGGKDSMSGSFEKLDVPPTVISFALGVTDAGTVVSNSLKFIGRQVHHISLPRDEYGLPEWKSVIELLRTLSKQIAAGRIDFCSMVDRGGMATAIAEACFGNGLGFGFDISGEQLFYPMLGDILISTENIEPFQRFEPVVVGTTIEDRAFVIDGTRIDFITALNSYLGTLEPVFATVPSSVPAAADTTLPPLTNLSFVAGVQSPYRGRQVATPRVLIPIFPGTNCEYDTAKRFEFAGAVVEHLVIRNLTTDDIRQSVSHLAERIAECQILAFAGGFSAGDEPDGSGKFISALMRSEQLRESIHRLLNDRDGLILGICNGFQALVKLGLLPEGRITQMRSASPTLTYNDIGRHISTISRVRVASNLSPWLSLCSVGEVFAVPVSHGEGKFVAPANELAQLIRHGQVATQYVDLAGDATYESPYNPNGSYLAIEGITSRDGRIFGKMGHIERIGTNLYKNVLDEYDMRVFEAGVRYFR